MCTLDTAVGKCGVERVAHGQDHELSGEANVHAGPLEQRAELTLFPLQCSELHLLSS